jgi:ABC-type phosphate/phosphonate transport system permease subunit
MGEILGDLYDQARSKRPRRSSLAILILITAVILLFVFSAIDFSKISWQQLLIGAVLLLVVAVSWFLSTLLPTAASRS